MSIIIPSQSGAVKHNLLTDNAAFATSFPQHKEDDTATPALRDKQAIYALHMVSQGEKRLQKILQATQTSGELKSNTNAFATQAKEELLSFAGSIENSETSRAVKQQLDASVSALTVRSKDLALREYLAECDAQLQQRKKDVGAVVYALADTAQNAPTAQLRLSAQQQLMRQVESYRKVKLATDIAKQRFVQAP